MTTTSEKEKKKQKRRTQAEIPFDGNAGAFQFQGARKYLGGISEPTLRRLIKKGKINPNRQLRHLLFSKIELDRFLNEPAK